MSTIEVILLIIFGIVVSFICAAMEAHEKAKKLEKRIDEEQNMKRRVQNENRFKK